MDPTPTVISGSLPLNSQTVELFPELKATGPIAKNYATPEAAALTSIPEERRHAAAVQMAVSGNTLSAASADLWNVLSRDFVDNVTKQFAPFSAFSYRYTSNHTAPLGVQTTLYTRVITGAGSAQTNPSDLAVSGLTDRLVPIAADLITVSNGLDLYDYESGNNMEEFLGAAAGTLVEACWGKVAAAVKAKLPSSLAATAAPASGKCGYFVMDPATFSGQTIAKSLSGIFGDYGRPHELLLDATTYGTIIPTSADSLNPQLENTYGVRRIHAQAGLSTIGTTVHGIVAQRSAIGIVAGSPALNLPMFQGAITRTLGTNSELPIILYAFPDYQHLRINFTVMCYFGAAVVNPERLYVLGEASSSSATPGS